MSAGKDMEAVERALEWLNQREQGKGNFAAAGQIQKRHQMWVGIAVVLADYEAKALARQATEPTEAQRSVWNANLTGCAQTVFPGQKSGVVTVGQATEQVSDDAVREALCRMMAAYRELVAHYGDDAGQRQHYDFAEAALAKLASQ